RSRARPATRKWRRRRRPCHQRAHAPANPIRVRRRTLSTSPAPASKSWRQAAGRESRAVSSCVSPSELVRAVGAEAGLVLQGDGVVGVVGIGLVMAELQAQQAELAVAPGQLGAMPVRIEVTGERTFG